MARANSGGSDRHLALMVPGLQIGGAQRRMVLLARAFAERGCDVDLLVVDPSGPLREEVSSGVQLVSLDRWWTRVPPMALKKRWRVMASLPSLVSYLRRERPTALMPTSHSACVTALLASQIAHVSTRCVARIDSVPSRAPELAGTRTQRRRMRKARRFFPRADALIAISQGVADDLIGEIGVRPERVTVIHNPIDKREIRERASAPLEHPWFERGKPPVVLGAGRFVAQKDFATLLRAFARVRAKREARLLILGEGPERLALESLAQELGVAADVSLPGFVVNPLPYMKRASVFVMSSAWEGFGHVLLEALACGCAVVSTDCPSGPAEILEGGSFGPLVPVGDDAALAGAVEGVLDQLPDPARLVKRVDAFDIDQIADRYLKVLLA